MSKDARRYKEFLEFQNLARHLASKFAKEYRKPYEEMVAAAEYALCLELFGRRGFDKRHGTKKSTWLYTVIYFHMTQVCTRGRHPCPQYTGSMQVSVMEWDRAVSFSVVGTEEMPELDPVEVPSFLTCLMAELGEEARALVRTVLEAPQELAAVVFPTTRRFAVRRAREAVRCYLIDEMDWTNDKVEAAWAEVQAALNGEVAVV